MCEENLNVSDFIPCIQFKMYEEFQVKCEFIESQILQGTHALVQKIVI